MKVETGRESVIHWIAGQLTAVALIPFGGWLGFSFLFLTQVPFSEASSFFASPWVTLCAALFVGLMFYHGYLGMQVVWEDYVPHGKTCRMLIFMTRWMSIIFATLGILSLIGIYGAS